MKDHVEIHALTLWLLDTNNNFLFFSRYINTVAKIKEYTLENKTVNVIGNQKI